MCSKPYLDFDTSKTKHPMASGGLRLPDSLLQRSTRAPSLRNPRSTTDTCMHAHIHTHCIHINMCSCAHTHIHTTHIYYITIMWDWSSLASWIQRLILGGHCYIKPWHTVSLHCLYVCLQTNHWSHSSADIYINTTHMVYLYGN